MNTSMPQLITRKRKSSDRILAFDFFLSEQMARNVLNILLRWFVQYFEVAPGNVLCTDDNVFLNLSATTKTFWKKVENMWRVFCKRFEDYNSDEYYDTFSLKLKFKLVATEMRTTRFLFIREETITYGYFDYYDCNVEELKKDRFITWCVGDSFRKNGWVRCICEDDEDVYSFETTMYPNTIGKKGSLPSEMLIDLTAWPDQKWNMAPSQLFSTLSARNEIKFFKEFGDWNFGNHYDRTMRELNSLFT